MSFRLSDKSSIHEQQIKASSLLNQIHFLLLPLCAYYSLAMLLRRGLVLVYSDLDSCSLSYATMGGLLLLGVAMAGLGIYARKKIIYRHSTIKYSMIKLNGQDNIYQFLQKSKQLYNIKQYFVLKAARFIKNYISKPSYARLVKKTGFTESRDITWDSQYYLLRFQTTKQREQFQRLNLHMCYQAPVDLDINFLEITKFRQQSIWQKLSLPAMLMLFSAAFALSMKVILTVLHRKGWGSSGFALFIASLILVLLDQIVFRLGLRYFYDNRYLTGCFLRSKSLALAFTYSWVASLLQYLLLYFFIHNQYSLLEVLAGVMLPFLMLRQVKNILLYIFQLKLWDKLTDPFQQSQFYFLRTLAQAQSIFSLVLLTSPISQYLGFFITLSLLLKILIRKFYHFVYFNQQTTQPLNSIKPFISIQMFKRFCWQTAISGIVVCAGLGLAQRQCPQRQVFMTVCVTLSALPIICFLLGRSQLNDNVQKLQDESHLDNQQTRQDQQYHYYCLPMNEVMIRKNFKNVRAQLNKLIADQTKEYPNYIPAYFLQRHIFPVYCARFQEQGLVLLKEIQHSCQSEREQVTQVRMFIIEKEMSAYVHKERIQLRDHFSNIKQLSLALPRGMDTNQKILNAVLQRIYQQRDLVKMQKQAYN